MGSPQASVAVTIFGQAGAKAVLGFQGRAIEKPGIDFAIDGNGGAWKWTPVFGRDTGQAGHHISACRGNRDPPRRHGFFLGSQPRGISGAVAAKEFQSLAHRLFVRRHPPGMSRIPTEYQAIKETSAG